MAKNSTMLIGASLAGLIILVILIGGIIIALNQEFHKGHYPGAKAIPRQNFYSLNLRNQYLRVENAYRTQDDMGTVYAWYEHRFGFHDFVRVNEPGGDCLDMQKDTKRLTTNHNIHIIICETPAGQIVFITRLLSPR